MTGRPVGVHVRTWRNRRQLSQLDLAASAEVSARHLSFVETGRAAPSRDMVLRLAEVLDVPIRERNVWLVAAGFAPTFSERGLDDAALAPARAAIELMLERQKPYPAFALDRHRNFVATNGCLRQMFRGVAEELLVAPVNGVRLSLHPAGLSSRIQNLAEWRWHVLHKLRQHIEQTGDPQLIALESEALAYPGPTPTRGTSEVMVPLRLRLDEGTVSFVTTTMVFGTALDATLADISVELFFAADEATDALVRGLA